MRAMIHTRVSILYRRVCVTYRLVNIQVVCAEYCMYTLKMLATETYMYMYTVRKYNYAHVQGVCRKKSEQFYARVYDSVNSV